MCVHSVLLGNGNERSVDSARGNAGVRNAKQLHHLAVHHKHHIKHPLRQFGYNYHSKNTQLYRSSVTVSQEFYTLETYVHSNQVLVIVS